MTSAILFLFLIGSSLALDIPKKKVLSAAKVKAANHANDYDTTTEETYDAYGTFGPLENEYDANENGLEKKESVDPTADETSDLVPDLKENSATDPEAGSEAISEYDSKPETKADVKDEKKAEVKAKKVVDAEAEEEADVEAKEEAEVEAKEEVKEEAEVEAKEEAGEEALEVPEEEAEGEAELEAAETEDGEEAQTRAQTKAEKEGEEADVEANGQAEDETDSEADSETDAEVGEEYDSETVAEAFDDVEENEEEEKKLVEKVDDNKIAKSRTTKGSKNKSVPKVSNKVSRSGKAKENNRQQQGEASTQATSNATSTTSRPITCPSCLLIHCETVEPTTTTSTTASTTPLTPSSTSSAPQNSRQSKKKKDPDFRNDRRKRGAEDEDFQPQFDESYYDSIELINAINEPADEMADYLEPITASKENTSRKKRHTDNMELFLSDFEPNYDQSYYDSVEINQRTGSIAYDAERYLNPVHEQRSEVDFMSLGNMGRMIVENATKCNPCRCNEGTMDLPLDSCIKYIVNPENVTVPSCKNSSFDFLEGFNSAEGKVALVFRLNKRNFENTMVHGKFSNDLHFMMYISMNDANVLMVQMQRRNDSESAIRYAIDLTMAQIKNGIIARFTMVYQNPNTSTATYYALSIGKSKVLSLPDEKHEMKDLADFNVYCTDMHMNHDPETDPCKQPAFGPILAKLKYPDRYVQSSSFGRRCLDKCRENANSSNVHGFHLCQTLPWLLNFSKIDNLPNVMQEDQYLSWDVCGKRQCNGSDCAYYTAHGFQCAHECTKLTNASATEFDPVVSSVYPHVCDIDRNQDSIFGYNETFLCQRSILLTNGNCPTQFVPRDFCTPRPQFEDEYWDQGLRTPNTSSTTTQTTNITTSSTTARSQRKIARSFHGSNVKEQEVTEVEPKENSEESKKSAAPERLQRKKSRSFRENDYEEIELKKTEDFKVDESTALESIQDDIIETRGKDIDDKDKSNSDQWFEDFSARSRKIKKASKKPSSTRK